MIVPYSRFLEHRLQRYLTAAAASCKNASVTDAWSAVIAEPGHAVAPRVPGRADPPGSREKRCE